ncbi:hypothetical protein AVEN_217286-1 [Araneus ventricosus]|uniref:Uncharacterized protein n=1 Tax=Araneus ventricosus TaxID=182803 RepID=A0A4Y2G515_ARAVE|nr:hypothetical protein AVEN_217286-1 [Araneus ventricosus]
MFYLVFAFQSRLYHQVNVSYINVPLSSSTRAFWDEPRNFEPRTDDDYVTRVGTPSPSFHITPTGSVWLLRLHGRSSVESGFEHGTLHRRSRGHRGPAVFSAII